MIFPARTFLTSIAVGLFIFLPLHLYADWSFKSIFTGEEQKNPATVSPAPVTVAQSPQYSGVAVAGLQPVHPAVPAGNGGVTTDDAVPQQKVLTFPRDLAPFMPALTVGAQVLSVDTEWRGAVFVDGGITVAPAATLTITPGTVVRFARGAGLHVLGRIVIKGTAENPVRLASVYRESQDSDWKGIILSGTEKKNIFENVTIEGAETAVFARFSLFAASSVVIGKSAVGFRLQNSTATIVKTKISVPVTALTAGKSEIFMEKCSITGGQSGVIVNSSAVEALDVSIKSCLLTAFTATASQLKLENISAEACQSAVRLSLCDGSINNSTFNNNSETGVVLSGSNLRFTGNTISGNKVGIQIDDNLPSLWSNKITGNSSYNLIYLGDEPLFAGGNLFDGKAAAADDVKVFSKRAGAVQLVPAFATEPQ